MQIKKCDISNLWLIASETNGYLIAENGRTLLIDCPEIEIPLNRYSLETPEVILHTHVQEEHCREWLAFPHATVYVPAKTTDIALNSPRFIAESRTVWNKNREWTTRGEEKYGIAGCVTERPPAKRLNVRGELVPGNIFEWENNHFEIIALPGHGKRSIGLFWRERKILFAGDLLRQGGFLVNIYDQERAYGTVSGYAQLRQSLRQVLQISPKLILPSTGPIIDAPYADIQALLTRLKWIKGASECESTLNFPPLREIGRWRELRHGIFQSNNFGNIIVFIDKNGHGLLLDPDPCIWLDWDTSCREVHADFDMLEHQAGLKTIDYLLITHYHGDHVQFAPLLRERYGAKLAATPDVAAILKYPQKFRYPCTLDWYEFPFATLDSDVMLEYDKPLLWCGKAVTPIHTPGHCYAHTGFLLEWNGDKIACVGDALSYGSGPVRISWPIVYNDIAWPDSSLLITLRKLAEYNPSLILCGHSHAFKDSNVDIIEKFISAYERAEQLAAAMLHDGKLMSAMTPPGYNCKKRIIAPRSWH